MLSSSRFNYLIEIIAKINEAVDVLRTSYESFPALIDEEHRMIASHTYTQRLDEICKLKTAQADKIVAAFEELQPLSQQVFGIWKEMDCEGVAMFPGDLSNCLNMITNIRDAIQTKCEGLPVSVMNFQLEKLLNGFQKFCAIAAIVKPKIELNRAALSGVVRSYQDSTRVLLDLCEQAQATYSSQGTQNKSATGVSTIFVRA